ncbi:MAG TPA: EAL domain-containing protein [Rhodocyclaceae bacterium]|nr:EAL domain-containing protein [Rhodocyclaceae bacterium]
MSEKTLAQLMTWNLVTVDREASLARAAEVMETAHISSVLVADQGKPVGIVTERDILRALEAQVPPDRAVAAVMASPLLSARQTVCIHEGYHLMAEKGVRHLLITDGEDRPVGIVSDSDFRFHLGMDFYRRLQDVRTVMSSQVPVMAPAAPLSEAVAAMAAREANCIVVAEDGIPVGIVTERDAVRFYRQGDGALAQPLAEVMSSPVAAIGLATHLHDAMDRMQAQRIRHLVVVGEDGRVAGVLSEHDVVRQLESEYLEFALRESRRTRQRLQESESELRQFQRAVEQCPVSIIITGTDAHIQYVNPKFTEITGYSRDEVLGRNPRILQSGLTPPVTYEQLWGSLKAGEVWTGELCNRRKNGEIFWELARILPITDASGQVSHFLAVKEDITERRQADQLRRLALRVFQSSHDGILITDPQGIIIDVNRAFTELTGYSRDEAVGSSSRLLNSGHHDQEFFRRLFATVAEHDYWQGELWNRTKAGAVSVVLMTVSAVRNAAGELTHYVGVFTDITQKKESEQRLERLAHYDALTGLPNRSLFRDRLLQAIKKSRRDGQSLALLFIDLDHFKEVNDTLGHMVGDQLLVEAAQRIAACVRASDTVARLGGDEFTVILPGTESPEAVERVAGAMVEALAAPFVLGRETAYVSASIGITLYPDDAGDPESLTRAADQAMYEAKAQGRNGFCFFADSMQVAARERLRLVGDLHAALKAGQFEVYYQPIVDLSTGTMVKAEALLRWHHPERGLVMPGKFIPVTEEIGLINDIGDWVFKEAAGMAGRWHGLAQSGASGPVQITLNKSPRQFLAGQTHASWFDHLKALGLPPGCIAIEITESLLLDNRAEVPEKLNQFREAGVEIALDDFGTGYSALSYLKKSPIDYLKIDVSFIAGLADDPGDRAIVEAMVVMAHKLGLKVVAEGVETAVQRDILLAAGCDYAQGYLFAPPMPSREFEARLAG